MKTKMGQRGFLWAELLIVLAVISVLVGIIYGPSSGAFDSHQTSETKQVAAAFEKSINAIRTQWSAEGGQKDTVECNGIFVEVTTDGWAKQLNSDVAGCISVWRTVLVNSPEITTYSKEDHAKVWSAGGGDNVCYFIYQQGEIFDEDDTPYFRYSNEIGQITLFNM